MSTCYMSEEDTRRFKSYMVGAGFSIKSLAENIGMARESLSARINGKVDFSRNEMINIAALFKKAPEEIFLG